MKRSPVTNLSCLGLIAVAAISSCLAGCGAKSEYDSARSTGDRDSLTEDAESYAISTSDGTQSAFPRDRSDSRRRIGLTKAVLQRLAAVPAYAPSAPQRSALLLRNFKRMIPKFSEQLDSAIAGQATRDAMFKTCLKTVATTGLVAALGDKDAERVVVEYLQAVSAPYASAAAQITDEATALSTWLNQDHSRARRVTAYNFLSAKGKAGDLKVGGGDSIFLEAGMESACLAVGYDWLYSVLDADQDASKKKNVEFALGALLRWALVLDEPFFRSDDHAVQRDSNWNPVMNGGAGLAALAALDDVSSFSCLPELDRQVTGAAVASWSLDALARAQVCRSVRAIKSYWAAFATTGAYAEGPSYWFYGMEYYVLFRDALRGVLGRDELWQSFGDLEKKSAIAQDMQMYQDGQFWPTDAGGPDSIELYNYGDSSNTVIPSSYPFLSTSARSGDVAIRSIGLRLLAQQLANEQSSNRWAASRGDSTRAFALFLDPDGTWEPTPFEPLKVLTDTSHRLDLVRMQTRSVLNRWVVHQKGGAFTSGHSHLDSGSFTLRIGGTTWLGELGLEHAGSGYPKGYFTTPADLATTYLRSLTYFKKNDLSHNLVSMADRPLRVSGSADLGQHQVTTVTDSPTPLYETTWDTTSLFAPVASSSYRKLRLADRGGYTSLDVIDQIDFPSAPDAGAMPVWHVTHCQRAATDGKITLRPDGEGNLNRELEISLTPPGATAPQKLVLSLLQPANAEFTYTAADPNAPATNLGKSPMDEEGSNEGCSLISVRAKTTSLTPLSGTGKRARFVVRMKQ